MCFQIKTTSPKDYVVKPNNGVIMPGEDKKIEFTMQPTVIKSLFSPKPYVV